MNIKEGHGDNSEVIEQHKNNKKNKLKEDGKQGKK
jgi:hypothetical protein